MIIKKFQGKTENDAVEAAKKELGSNIVIMNVRNVKRKGILRFFLSETVEVTVALEEENERYAPVRSEEKREPVLPAGSMGYPQAREPYQNRKLVVEDLNEEKRDNAFLEEKLNNLHSL